MPNNLQPYYRWFIYLGVLAIGTTWYARAWAATANQGGVTTTEILRTAGIVAAIVAIVMLVVIEFILRERLSRSMYHWLMFFGLLALPGLALLGTTETVFQETKKVKSCQTCHVMEPFVQDMKDPNSASLAARHYKHNWISSKQCYQCHTTYGAHGTLASKRDGFRHWMHYVTGTWPRPIQYVGSYPNSNCTECHAGTPSFEAVASHDALSSELKADAVNCTDCHGPPHPTPSERNNVKSSAAHE